MECNRVNNLENNRCINCGAKDGHRCLKMPLFAAEEIQEMEQDIVTLDLIALSRKELWVKAFNFYNKYNGYKFNYTMNCKPCYAKVLYFIKTQNIRIC